MPGQLQTDDSNPSTAPAQAPYRTLNGGAKMPAIGLGTFGSDHVSHQTRCRCRADMPLRSDTGTSTALLFMATKSASGVSSESFFRMVFVATKIWITSKLWNDKHGENDVIPSCEKSLNDLQLDYLDLYLVHWPFPNHHPPGCDVTARNPLAVPYIHDKYMRTWRKMEELVDRGLVRHIGTSNMTIPKMKLLLARCADQARRQRDGTSSALSAAGVFQLPDGERNPAHRFLPARFARASGARSDS